MRYFTVTEEELESARPGLVLVEKLMQDEFSAYIYGITTKDTVLMSAQDSLSDYADEEEGGTAPSLDEVAVAIPFSSEAVYLLTGSGLSIKRADFAYRGGSDGPRMHWLSNKDVQVNIHDFSAIALSDSDTWIEEFLNEHGVRFGQMGNKDIVVPRTEPAVQARMSSVRVGQKKASAMTFAKLFTGGIDRYLSQN